VAESKSLVQESAPNNGDSSLLRLCEWTASGNALEQGCPGLGRQRSAWSAHHGTDLASPLEAQEVN
jgi:hypothetical protein